MSQTTTAKIPCPSCQEPQDFVIYQTINVATDPETKPRLLAGELNRLTCAKCGKSAMIVYPVLYNDANRKLMIWLMPDAGPATGGDPPVPVEVQKQLGDSQLYRRVGMINELIEKILIFDADLDDRFIELIKVMVWSQLPAEHKPAGSSLLFARVDGPAPESPPDARPIVLAIAGPPQGGAVSVPREMYDGARETFGPAVGPQRQDWPRIDLKFAVAILQAATANLQMVPQNGEGAPAQPQDGANAMSQPQAAPLESAAPPAAETSHPLGTGPRPPGDDAPPPGLLAQRSRPVRRLADEKQPGRAWWKFW